MRRTLSTASLVCVGLLACGSTAANAARGPLSAPHGASGALQVLRSLRVSFPVPSSFDPYETVNGTPVDGGFIKQVQVGSRTCRVVLRVQGRVQHSLPTTKKLTQAHVTFTARGLVGGRHWALGQHSGDWLADSWRAATPSTERYGRYIDVITSVTSDPSVGTTCDRAIAAEKTAAQKIAQSWVVVRAS